MCIKIYKSNFMAGGNSVSFFVRVSGQALEIHLAVFSLRYGIAISDFTLNYNLLPRLETTAISTDYADEVNINQTALLIEQFSQFVARRSKINPTNLLLFAPLCIDHHKKI